MTEASSQAVREALIGVVAALAGEAAWDMQAPAQTLRAALREQGEAGSDEVSLLHELEVEIETDLSLAWEDRRTLLFALNAVRGLVMDEQRGLT